MINNPWSFLGDRIQ